MGGCFTGIGELVDSRSADVFDCRDTGARLRIDGVGSSLIGYQDLITVCILHLGGIHGPGVLFDSAG